jgi:hypothetical protein
MSGNQTFHRRVTIPVVVILTTVSSLFLVGYKLWKLDPVVVADQPAVSASPLESITAMPTALPSDSVDPGLDVNGRLPVIVLNGTETPGLAKVMSDELHDADWVVDQTGNWTGEPLLVTTIFYPANGFASAEELVIQTGGTPVEATSDMSQTALTLVIIQ